MNRARLQERLLAYTQKQDNGCWEWRGQISNSGHGRIMLNHDDGSRSYESVCSASYLAFNGAAPEGKQVFQHCENRLCLNPEHLELR